jgi:hypothetical protein
MPLQRIPGAMVSDQSLTTDDLAPGTAARLVRDIAKVLTGSTVTFTGIPSWARRVTVAFNDLSTAGSGAPRVQLGSSGGYETSGYAGTIDVYTTAVSVGSITNGIPLANTAASSANFSGTVSLVNISANLWIATVIGYTSGGSNVVGASSKTLTGTLDRLQLIAGGTTFDNGTANILYEG